MFYQILEKLLQGNSLDLASDSDITKLDSYLASLTSGQSNQISPWRVSNKTGIALKAIYEVFFILAQKGAMTIRYELWHPDSRIKVFETFDKSDLVDVCHYDEEGNLPPDYKLSDNDIHISFRLNDLKDSKQESKKKAFTLFVNSGSAFKYAK